MSTTKATCLAVIPARGGSKEIPRKNIQIVAGKPLLAHTIEAALSAQSVDRVVVSTDDAEIGEIAMAFGAEVVWRPDTISGDKSASEEAVLHVIQTFADREGYHPELVAFLQCTAPLTLGEDIDGVIATLTDQDADSALSVSPFFHFVWRIDKTGQVYGVNHDTHHRPMRQDRIPEYLETGAVYAFKTDGFVQHRYRFFGKTVAHILPHERTFEIDNRTELDMAGWYIQALRRKRLAWPPRILALVLDFDGVFTDNRVSVSQDGTESVSCNRSDGYGLKQLREQGVTMLVISAEPNPVVTARCDKLQIECRQGIENKLPVFETWCASRGIPMENAIYIGNDTADVPCLTAAGLGVVPADAQPSALAAAGLVLKSRGGDGAIRELCDAIEEQLARTSKET